MQKSVILLVLLGVAVGPYVYNNSDYVRRKREDKIIANYKPSATLEKYSSIAGLTEASYRLLYVNTPTISTDKTYIVSKCDKHQNSKALTFGCYLPRDGGIYVLELTDERYTALTATTVAHEVLHAAYERLGFNEKADVKAELQRLYDGQLHEELDTRLKAYGVTGDDFFNELHSIIGTEFPNLSPLLEQHYAKYLKDRKGLANYQLKSIGGIKEQHANIKEMQFTLNHLKTEIDELQNRILSLKGELESDQSQLPSAANPQLAVQEFNAKVNAYNEMVSMIRTKSDFYNSRVKEINALIGDSNHLAELVKPVGDLPQQ
jgi:hypothetical protein